MFDLTSTSNIEVFDLIETFVRLKSELFVKVRHLFKANYPLLKELFRVLIDNVDRLNDFTLTGVKVFRKIFEFALKLIGQWYVPNGDDDVVDGVGGLVGGAAASLIKKPYTKVVTNVHESVSDDDASSDAIDVDEQTRLLQQLLNANYDY